MLNYPIQRPDWLQPEGNAQLFWASIHKDDVDTMANGGAYKPLVTYFNENTGWWELWQLLPAKENTNGNDGERS